MNNPTEQLTQPAWDTFFEEQANSGVARVEQLFGSGDYSKKIVVPSFSNDLLEMYISESTGRRRVELSPVVVWGSVRIADRVGVITSYGNYQPNSKEPAGHTYLNKTERWMEPFLSKYLLSVGDEESGWEVLEESEPNKNGQTFRKEQKILQTGVAVRHTIVSGKGEGRVWLVRTSNNPVRIPFECRNGPEVNLSLGLAYGITIQQGDISDKIRSPRGATHYEVSSFSL